MNTGQVSLLLEESRWLTGLAHRLVSDPSLADDLAQETLLSAITASRQPSVDSTRGWLATILRRKVVGHKREEARRDYRQRVTARGEALPSAEEVGMLLDGERLLIDAVAELREPYRRVISLRYREGLSAAEIARRDGEPAGTVRSRLKTGLKMLRDSLEKRDQAWAMTLVPLAALPPATSLAAKAAGSSAIAGYVIAAAATALVAVPLAWRALRPDEVRSGEVRSGEVLSNVEEPAQPDTDTGAIAAAAEPAAAATRIQLDSSDARSVGDEAPGAEVPQATAVEIEPGVIELTVVDDQGLPITGAYAERWDNDQHVRYSKESGADGALQIALPRQERKSQDQLVLIRAPGWAAAREDLTFRAGQTIQHPEIVLTPAARIHGTVQDPRGENKQYGAVFVAPLPEELMAKLTGGMSIREIDDDLKDLDFLGAFEPTSRETNEFTLSDVAPGTRGQVLVFNDDDGGRIGWSEVMTTESGLTTELNPIAILAPTPEDLTNPRGVEVRIAVPRGAPLADFSVSASSTQDKVIVLMNVEQRSRTDFFVPCSANKEFSISVRARDGGYVPTRRSGVTLEAGPVVIEMATVPLTDVAVIDEHDEPVDSFEVQLFEYSYRKATHADLYRSVAGSKGAASFTPPPFRWRLRLVSGDSVAELGPFDEGTYSGPSSIHLDSSRTYRGRVERNGEAWASATLTLRERSPEGSYFLDGEIIGRANPGAVSAETVTTADGHFTFPAVKAGEYIVTARSKGAPTAAFEVDVDQELVLVAPPTGSISGTVEAEFGELAPGTVTASHELGLRRSATFASDGTFQLHDLPEGKWRLSQTFWSYESSRLGEPNWSSYDSDSQGPGYRSLNGSMTLAPREGVDVSVKAGVTTDVQLVVQTEPLLTLEGTIKVNGRQPRERSLHFQKAPWTFDSNLVNQRWERTNRDGDFKVELPGAGRWRLTSVASIFQSGLFAEFDVTDPPGPLEVNFKTGTLIVTGIPKSGTIRVEVDGGQTADLRLGATHYLLGQDGERQTIREMLAGEATIKALDGRTTPLATGALAPGETLEINLGQ